MVIDLTISSNASSRRLRELARDSDERFTRIEAELRYLFSKVRSMEHRGEERSEVEVRQLSGELGFLMGYLRGMGGLFEEAYQQFLGNLPSDTVPPSNDTVPPSNDD